jgi:hypothetical protein
MGGESQRLLGQVNSNGMRVVGVNRGNKREVTCALEVLQAERTRSVFLKENENNNHKGDMHAHVVIFIKQGTHKREECLKT